MVVLVDGCTWPLTSRVDSDSTPRGRSHLWFLTNSQEEDASRQATPTGHACWSQNATLLSRVK
ncbi:hypothetical protein E2C01_056146 [Portunus trituberculatus]|uniref:Uncharacterized protein n=1 Tax=Portunus trituberculatus TaxID=210409 RepID=A0A5B7GWT2_PORTR|nr:hypothetical protein [Portunus trituberculatus]